LVVWRIRILRISHLALVVVVLGMLIVHWCR
jgi:hypothetical protein